jgi:hypothetical protein
MMEGPNRQTKHDFASPFHPHPLKQLSINYHESITSVVIKAEKQSKLNRSIIHI